LVGYIFSRQKQKINTATKKKKYQHNKKKINLQINKSPKKINKSPKSGEVSPVGTTKNHKSGEISLDPVRSHLIWNHQKLMTTISFIVMVRSKRTLRCCLRLREGERELLRVRTEEGEREPLRVRIEEGEIG
jgi:hypothetical protein